MSSIISKNQNIAAVTLTHATIGKQVVEWKTLLAAAVQDYQSAEICIAPNGDRALADTYRAILRDCLPLVKMARDEAYNKYCSTSVTTYGSDPAHFIGHGSWITGPDGRFQREYQDWDILIDRIAKAARQPAGELT